MSVLFFLCIFNVACELVCGCVRSVDTQVWKLHLVDGDGLMLGVSRCDGNHSGRAGRRPGDGA